MIGWTEISLIVVAILAIALFGEATLDKGLKFWKKIKTKIDKL